MPDTDTTTSKDLWCATCGAYRGTTDRPYLPRRHRPSWFQSHEVPTCTDTETVTDD